MPYTIVLVVIVLLFLVMCLVSVQQGTVAVITYQVEAVLVKDTGRNGVQHNLVAVYIQRMACIGATLETGNYIVLCSKEIHDLTFPFIAPLQAEQNIDHNKNLARKISRFK